jgi:hypothetical protein
MQAIFTEAATVGRAMAEALAFAPRECPRTSFMPTPASATGRRSFFSDPTFHEPEYLAIDLRSKYAFEAIGTAKSMVVSVPGQGSQYIGAYQDADGDWLTGDNSYRIQLPKDVPANMFWSLTVYDNDTRSMIQNQHGRPLVGSVHGAVANEDGSFDLYFGPNQPADVPEVNWVQTTPGKGWFVYLRLYGPENSLLRENLDSRRCGKAELNQTLDGSKDYDALIHPSRLAGHHWLVRSLFRHRGSDG